MNMFRVVSAYVAREKLECRKNEDDIYGMSFRNIIRETRGGMTKGK